MNIWQLQEAKARLSEVVRLCNREGPQMISVQGVEKAVLLSKVDYEKLIGKKPHLIDFLRTSPLVGVELDLQRDQSLDRDIDI
jgi:prevent-host-death family protein